MSEDVNESMVASALKPGDIVTGRVTAIDDKKVSVDIGYKFEGVIPIRDLSSIRIQHPQDVVSEGQEVQAVVVKVDDDDNVVLLSKRDADAHGAWEDLQDKFEAQTPFEVVIHDVVKGGLVTDVGVRGFIPASMIDRHFVSDLTEFKGKTVQVVVAEIDRENNRLILSRKAVLDQEQRSSLTDAMDRFSVGDVLTGTVARLTNFGAFVDIGGVDGLVHISELAWNRVNHPSDVVQEGEQVRVRVIRLDPERGKISLSIKEAAGDPWEDLTNDYHEGDVLTGVVRRVVDFGAFVELRPGLEGLVHVSQIANQHVAHPADVLQEGDEVQVKVLGVDPERKRISLSIKEAEYERSRRDRPAASHDRSPDRSHDRQPRANDRQSSEPGTGATLGDLFGDLFKRE